MYKHRWGCGVVGLINYCLFTQHADTCNQAIIRRKPRLAIQYDYIYTYACMCTNICIYVCKHIYIEREIREISVHRHMCMYVQMKIRLHVLINTYASAFTHAHRLPRKKILYTREEISYSFMYHCTSGKNSTCTDVCTCIIHACCV